MNQRRRYYTAALLEGEGSFIARGVSITHVDLSVRCSMTDIELLKRLQKYCGGRIVGPYKRDIHLKSFYIWYLNKRGLVIELITQIRDLMSGRRKEQIDILLRLDSQYPLRRKPSEPLRHGFYTMYTSPNNCRCADCKKAWSVHQKEYRLRKKVENGY